MIALILLFLLSLGHKSPIFLRGNYFSYSLKLVNSSIKLFFQSIYHIRLRIYQLVEGTLTLLILKCCIIFGVCALFPEMIKY